MVAQHRECNILELCTLKWLQRESLCFVYLSHKHKQKDMPKDEKGKKAPKGIWRLEEAKET